MFGAWKWYCGLVVLCAWCCTCPAASVLITNLPAYSSFDNLGGIVLGASPSNFSVAPFIYVPGNGWVTKPTCAQPLATIQPDSSWTADITTGGSDQLATRIAAMLVQTNFNQSCIQGSAFLPTNLFNASYAAAIVTRPATGTRVLNFSGYDWWLKSSTNMVGPGPNYFSDSTNNVWLDSLGRLHLRLTNRSNQWQCAEVVSTRTFGYGSYRFELATAVDNLNPNVVLGLFTWSDDPVFSDREIDVECSRWGNAGDTNNSQFVVQPFGSSGHLARFAVPHAATNSTVLFTWTSNSVSFQALAGSFSLDPAPQNVISNWLYSLAVPQTGDENVRLNLWLMNGSPPTDQQEVEIIVNSFEFVPLGSPAPAMLTPGSRASPNRTIVHAVQPDRRYEVLGSSNLTDWQSLATLLATNSPLNFLDTNFPGPARRFYRTITLP